MQVPKQLCNGRVQQTAEPIGVETLYNCHVLFLPCKAPAARSRGALENGCPCQQKTLALHRCLVDMS